MVNVEVLPASAFQVAFNAMTAAGMSASLAADLLSAVLVEGASKAIKQPSAGAIRTRRYRERLSAAPAQISEVSHGVTCDEKRHKASQSVTCDAPPLQTPIKNLPTEEGSRVLEFAGARPEESKTGFGYSSHDGSVSFTAAEITKLGLDCYTLTNVYGQVRSLAESSWVEGMRPPDRKRAIVNKIKKLHNGRVRDYAPSLAEQHETVKQSIESQQDEQERARQARNRALGGRRVG